MKTTILINRIYSKALALSALLFFCTTVQAGEIVGNDAINRLESDSWSNFVLGLTAETFTGSGTVTDWNVYTNNAGTLGMLLLRNTTGENYEVIGADFRNAAAGLNSFSFSADTGSANIMAGDLIGLFIGTSKVDFAFTDDPIAAQWCGSNGCITDYETQLAAGEIVALTGGPQGRTYSANVTTVPEPGMLTLLALGLLGLRTIKRQKV